MRHLKDTSRGFTLVEMLVVAPVVILAIGAFLTAIISMTGEVLSSRAANNLSFNVQDALNRIEQDVKLSSTFLASNTVLGTGQGYNDDATGFTNASGGNGTALILSMVGTTGNPISTSSAYVFLKDKPSDCSSAQNNIPFTYNVIYFVKNDTLFRRTVMPTNYNDTTNTVCSVPWQQPSCSPTYMDTTPNPPSNFCKTKDIVLVEGIASADFALQYFNGESSTTENTTASSATAAADRAAALRAATTVGVTINAKQTVAGRPVERLATVKASRLDTNASSIAAITADGVPAAPSILGRVGEPTNVLFTWSKVPSATSYVFEYQINTGSWTSVPTTGQTYTVTTASHNQVVTGRVMATGPGGSSGYTTTAITIPLWTPLFLQGNWTDYSPPFTSAAYTKTAAGLVVLKGLVKSGSGVIGTLPVGYRPAGNIMFENSSNGSAGRVDVQSNGTINLVTGTNGWFSLDGVTFMPSSATFTPAVFANSWGNYSPASGDPNWQQAGYLLDSAGRVQLTGLVRAGTTTSETTMITLPAGYLPPDYHLVVNNITGAMGSFGIHQTLGVTARGYSSNNYHSLQAMYYPAGRATGTTCTTQWCNLTLQNSWVAYAGGFTTPQYTKSSDGLVMIKGLVRTGSSATAVIATLPVGYCPAEQQLLTTVSNSAWTRVDIIRNTNGTCTISPITNSSTAWFSLDSLRYMAEP